MAPGSAWRIGLTGGIGSGKSTVAKLFVACGAVLVDADAVSRSVTAPGGAAISAIAACFGPAAMSPDGGMNRDVMRKLVFSNRDARQQLEAIVHPLVSSAINWQAQSAVDAGARGVVFDVPLLVESARWRPQLDVVVVVDCDEATQQQRILARQANQPSGGDGSGWTAETARQVIAQQASRQARAAAADMSIFNDGLSMAALQLVVTQMARRFGL